MADQTGYAKLNESLLIFRQVDRINQLSSGALESTYLQDFQKFKYQLLLALKGLQAMLVDLVDKKTVPDDNDVLSMTSDRWRKMGQYEQIEYIFNLYRYLLKVLNVEGKWFPQIVEIDLEEDELELKSKSKGKR